MPRLPVDHSKALIYKIVCNDLNIKDCYVGSTTDFRKRKNHHKSVCNNANSKRHNLNVYQFIRANGGWDNFNMVLVELYPCETSLELLKRERHWTEQLKANLNIMKNQGIIKEIGEALYSKNKFKEYKEKHKEDMAINNKQYRLKNADRIKEYKSTKHMCECGCNYTNGHKQRHERSQKHQDFINNK